MSNHTSHERRLAIRDASHKGHIMSHWSEVGKPTVKSPIGGNGSICNLIQFKHHLDSVPKVTYCGRCGRSIVVGLGYDIHGTALEFECDAPPIQLGVGVEGLRELGIR